MANRTHRMLQLMALGCGIGLLVACNGDDEGVLENLVPAPDWFKPQCTVVKGEPVAAFTPDLGATLVLTEESPETGLGNPERAIAEFAFPFDFGGWIVARNRGYLGSPLLQSFDAGCSWSGVQGLERDIDAIAATSRYVYALTDGEVFRLGPLGSIRGPLVDEVVRLMTTPDDPDAVYALAAGFRILRSDNRGRNWAVQGHLADPQGEALSAGRVIDLRINPHDSLHFVVLRDEENFSDTVLNISVDGGSTWLPTDMDLVRQGYDRVIMSRIAIGGDPQVPDVWLRGVRTNWLEEYGVYGEAQQFVARSTDGGLTFGDAFTDEFVREMHPRGNVIGELYWRDAGVYRYRASDDSIRVITEVTDISPGSECLGSFAVHPGDSDTLYYGYESNCLVTNK